MFNEELADEKNGEKIINKRQHQIRPKLLQFPFLNVAVAFFAIPLSWALQFDVEKMFSMLSGTATVRDICVKWHHILAHYANAFEHHLMCEQSRFEHISSISEVMAVMRNHRITYTIHTNRQHWNMKNYEIHFVSVIEIDESPETFANPKWQCLIRNLFCMNRKETKTIYLNVNGDAVWDIYRFSMNKFWIVATKIFSSSIQTIQEMNKWTKQNYEQPNIQYLHIICMYLSNSRSIFHRFQFQLLYNMLKMKSYYFCDSKEGINPMSFKSVFALCFQANICCKKTLNNRFDSD